MLRLDVYHHFDFDPSGNDVVIKKLDRILVSLGVIQGKEDQIMATLQEVLDNVAAETTVIDSVLALITGLQQQLADILSGVNLPPAVQEKVDAVFAAVDANKAKLSTAIVTNT